MNRKLAVAMCAITLMTLATAVLATVTMPVWVVVLLINPKLFNPVSERIAKEVTQQVMKGMMRNVGVRLLASLSGHRKRILPSTGSNRTSHQPSEHAFRLRMA